jgi:DNA adenine methylase
VKATGMMLKYVPEHMDYIEAFAGGASMFFNKPMSARNWINDLHPGAYAFYIAVRDYYDEFAEICLNRQYHADRLVPVDDPRRTPDPKHPMYLDTVSGEVVSSWTAALRAGKDYAVKDAGRQYLEERFNYWKNRTDLMNNASDVVERAAQFYFLNRTVWGGRVVYDPARKSRLYFSNPEGWNNIEKKMEQLEEISEMLQWVKITCLPFEKCIIRGDDCTFMYLDPPYYRDSVCSNSDRLYDIPFAVSDHVRLKELVSCTDCKVMLSYEDREEVRRLYEGWNMVELGWTYSGRYAKTTEERANGTKEKKPMGRELLIMNYEVMT